MLLNRVLFCLKKRGLQFHCLASSTWCGLDLKPVKSVKAADGQSTFVAPKIFLHDISS